MATLRLDDAEARRTRNMQMFNRDLDILMDQLNGMLAHYQIGDWETYVFFRKRGCPDSYVLGYDGTPDDEFAQKIVDLHRSNNA